MNRIDTSMHTINGALEFHDFTDVDGVNFYHHDHHHQFDSNFIVEGSDEDQNPDVQFDYDHHRDHNLISGCNNLMMGDHYKIFGPTTPPAADMFAPFSNANNSYVPAAGCGPSFVLNNAFMMPSFEGGLVMKEGPDKEVVNNNNNDIGEVSSGSRSNSANKTRRYVRTSRTLNSERWRRGRMKEKLYELRALVPNITKMDKASIVGDASQYMKELQMQAKKLKAEIADLEASLVGPQTDDHGSMENIRKIQMKNTNQPNSKKITQVNLFQVEQKGYYVKLVCEKGLGVPASLYKVLESLTIFNVHNSNLATAFESYVLTTELNVKECNQEVNLPNLRRWLIGALLNQGFELVQTTFSS